jgi:hypothetical protein
MQVSQNDTDPLVELLIKVIYPCRLSRFPIANSETLFFYLLVVARERNRWYA